MGKWQIHNNALYLVHLKYKCNDEDFDLVSPLMPSADHGIANWYSGELRIPMGEIIHNNGYFYPLHEKEMRCTVEKGVIINQKIIENEAPEIDEDEDSLPF
mgnify:CR=1 FL=1